MYCGMQIVGRYYEEWGSCQICYYESVLPFCITTNTNHSSEKYIYNPVLTSSC